MADIIQFRRGTAAAWASANPVLAQGEEGYELDTGLEKRGDGVTAWNSLAYKPTGSGSAPVAVTYATASALFAAQGAQVTNYIYEVTDASDYAGVTSGTIWVRYLGTTNGDESDYTKPSSVGDGGSGDVTGAASSTDNNFVFFNGATGKILKDSGLSKASIDNVVTKLATIETNAKDDQTGAEIKALYEAESNTNAFTDAEKSKLAGLESSHFKGTFVNLSALDSAYPTASEGDYAHVDAGVGSDVEVYIWDNDDDNWVIQVGTGTTETAASIKTKYESNADTNAFTDAEKSKLASITAIFTTTLKTAYDSAVTWISTNGTNLLNHLSNTSNPHNVTKAQVGLSNVDNTSDSLKPVSTAQASAIALKQNKQTEIKTGSTVVFTENADYNATTPVTSGNITLSDTGAIAGVTCSFYINSATEPELLGGLTISLKTGFFTANTLNIYHFSYNTDGKIVLNIQANSLSRLIAPINFAYDVLSDTEIDLDWDDNVNATNYILQRDTDIGFGSPTEVYSGASNAYSDTGLTISTLYHYRVKCQADGYLDSVWKILSATTTDGGLTEQSITFTNTGLTESPANTFQNQNTGNYGVAYAVSTVAFSGDFNYSVELEANDVRGCMFGVSSSALNVAFNDGSNPWNFIGQIQESTNLIRRGINGVMTDTAITATYGSGNKLSLRRTSNNLKLYFNETEVYDFGTYAPDVYLHISAYGNTGTFLYIKNPKMLN